MYLRCNKKNIFSIFHSLFPPTRPSLRFSIHFSPFWQEIKIFIDMSNSSEMIDDFYLDNLRKKVKFSI